MSSVRRSLWLSLADSYLGLVLQIASTMIVSRVLTPADIGIIAIASVFSALAGMLRDFGVTEYLIQERELTPEKVAAALMLNICISWAMAVAMYLGAPAAAAFYSNAGIAEVMHVQAIGFLLVPFGAVTMAYFRREMNFRPVVVCNLAGNLTSFVLSVGLVLHGFGFTSLAWGNLASIAVTVALSVWYRPASFPRWPSWKGVAEVFHFSKFVSMSYVTWQAGKGMPELILGRAEGVVGAAMWSRGNGLVELFNKLVMRSVVLVFLPYLAKNDREDGVIAPSYAKAVASITVVAWPFLTFLGLAALPVIRIMYGPQWDAAVVLAQALCLARAIDIVHAMSREALLARGLSGKANTLETLLVSINVLGLLLVIPFGLIGAAWGTVASALIGICVSQLYLSRYIELSARQLLAACAPGAAVSAMAVAPAALWAVLVPVTPERYLAFGFGGAALTAISWLAAAQLMRHPILRELEPVFARVRRWRGAG